MITPQWFSWWISWANTLPEPMLPQVHGVIRPKWITIWCGIMGYAAPLQKSVYIKVYKHWYGIFITSSFLWCNGHKNASVLINMLYACEIIGSEKNSIRAISIQSTTSCPMSIHNEGLPGTNLLWHSNTDTNWRSVFFSSCSRRSDCGSLNSFRWYPACPGSNSFCV